MPVARSHTLLLVVSDSARAASLAGLVKSLGYASHPASTLEEALAAAAKGPCCGILMGQFLAVDAGATVGEAGTEMERAVAALRGIDPRRNGDDHHVLPLVLFGESTASPAFVSRMHRLGIDEFIVHDADGDRAATLDRIRFHLRSAGRERHARCAALKPPERSRSLSEVPKEVRLTFTAERVGHRTLLLVDAEPVAMPAREFAVLLIFAAERSSGAQAWVTHRTLGIAGAKDLPFRINRALGHLMPDGVQVVESDFAGRRRLHADIVVTNVPWAALADHASGVVREVVAKYWRD